MRSNSRIIMKAPSRRPVAGRLELRDKAPQVRGGTDVGSRGRDAYGKPEAASHGRHTPDGQAGPARPDVAGLR